MSDLPIEDVLAELLSTLNKRDEVVLEAPPGAGKTTRVPLALLDQSWVKGQKIIMLEPRRLAARAAAEYMASQLNEPVGQTVGYRVRLDTKISAQTRIEVVTEGILTRMLQDDPSLEGIGLLIFDEFHERSIDADTGLALSLQARELFRDNTPLKLLVMSATLNGAALAKLLGEAPVIRSEGRLHPVEVKYGEPWRAGKDLLNTVVATVNRALSDETGSVLVFLPGQKEIRQVHTSLQKHWEQNKAILLTPLYGDLTLAQQRAAIEPAPSGKRKIVLATDIAETSLTIDGVTVVIDAGLSREAAFDTKTGMTRLHTRRVSQASSIQRMGRAGRLQPGVCYRLWSESQQQQLIPYSSPAIKQADLLPLALQLLKWGVSEPSELSWLDPPPVTAYQRSLNLLVSLGAVKQNENGQWQLTSHGEAMAGLPLHPRLAHMMLIAQQVGLETLACDIAALLSERDPVKQTDVDIQLRLRVLSEHSRSQQGVIKRIQQQSKNYRQLLSKIQLNQGDDRQRANDISDPRWTGFLLACAYPDRIANQRQAHGTEYRLSNGRAARLSEHDAFINTPWLVIANLGSKQGDAVDRIYLAAELDSNLFEDQLLDLVITEDKLYWDTQSQRLVAEQQDVIGDLVLARRPSRKINPEKKSQLLIELIRKQGLQLLPWSDENRQWLARVMLLRQLELDEQGTSEWPELSDTALLDSLEDWLGPYLAPVANQITTLDHFAVLDMNNILKAMLSWDRQSMLDEWMPERFQVPSGSRIRIDYSESPPVLAVRMQEMFGCSQTPTIAAGRLPLKIHLLSPARRPLQVTQDLASFWKNGYPEVKKEMKGRYPKHYWPDNPLVAEATARVRPKPKK
ncbi:MAG: ATP-dependent helicase HrpB [Gammaproteobacteria bacterium]|nr:ATP-dependent helicase HrpB [Gammaproteobacteria bacterium]